MGSLAEALRAALADPDRRRSRDGVEAALAAPAAVRRRVLGSGALAAVRRRREQDRSRSGVIRSIRILGAALGAFVGLGLAAAGTGLFADLPYAGFMLAAWTIAWVVVGFAVLPYLTVVPARWLIKQVQELSTAEFVAAILGLFVGLLLGLLLGLPLAQIEGPLGTWLPLGISLFLGLGMMGLTVAKRFDLIAAAEGAGLIRRPGRERRRRPRASRGSSSTPACSSTAGSPRSSTPGSSTGRWSCRGSCSRSSSTSPTRPTRCAATAAGAGSRSSTRMQRDPRTPVEIVEDEAPGVAEVDAKLVELAKRRSRVVLTNDFNLNRVAELQGVRVMNINSLANAVKPAVLPGEELRVKVIQEGKEAGQGVGFLDDGTMIVVEGGARLIDRDVDVSVTRVLQTVAGRMIFAQPRLD